MSFKSRQREKHSHLFGDDIANTTTVTTTPTTTKLSDTHTCQPKQSRLPLDPLSRCNSPDTSNNDSSPNGSIFGGVDVSKFSSKHNNGRSTTSITCSNPTLQVAGNDNISDTDDNDYVFGGGKKSSASTHLGSRKSTSTSPTMTAKTASAGSLRVSIPLSPSSNSAIYQHTYLSSSPIPRVESTSSLDSYSSTRSQIKQPTDTTSTKNQVPLPPPARHPTSISISAISPLVSSSTSSISSDSSYTSSSPTMIKSHQVPPPPPRIHKKHQQGSLKQIKFVVDQNNNNNNNNSSNENDDNERMMEQQRAAMMEDEATQAFAMEPTTTAISLIPDLSSMHDDNDDDPEFYASVTQYLTITESSSTPTHNTSSGADNQPILLSHANPWWDTTYSFSAPHLPLLPASSATATAATAAAAALEAKKQGDLDKKLKAMEPAKRAAFADLIADWHGDHYHHHKRNNNDDSFLSYVASEQKDIGFAGINSNEQMTRSHDSNGTSSFDWQQGASLDDNPWS